MNGVAIAFFAKIAMPINHSKYNFIGYEQLVLQATKPNLENYEATSPDEPMFRIFTTFTVNASRKE